MVSEASSPEPDPEAVSPTTNPAPAPNNAPVWDSDDSSSINPESPVHAPLDLAKITEAEEQERRDSGLQRRQSSITSQIENLPEDKRAALESAKHRPAPSPLHARQNSIPSSSSSSLPLPVPHRGNPVANPNWGPDVFTKSEPSGTHLASKVQEAIEEWVCTSLDCRERNASKRTVCKGCGRMLPKNRGFARGYLEVEMVDSER